MEARKPATIGLTVLAYVAATFGVQGASHFAVFAAHYAAIPIMRAEPVIAMGLGSMLIQGVLFALLFPTFQHGGDSVWDGVKFSWALGGFLASYIVLGEAGKYAIPFAGPQTLGKAAGGREESRQQAEGPPHAKPRQPISS